MFRFHPFRALVGVVILCLYATSGGASSLDVIELAIATKRSINQNLEVCGTLTLDPNDPRLPRPQTGAHEAYANLEQSWLAGYYQRVSQGPYLIFSYMWPNGNVIASIHTTDNASIQFSNGSLGVQVSATKYTTPQGDQWHFFCKNREVGRIEFEGCIQSQFVGHLLKNFCYR